MPDENRSVLGTLLRRFSADVASSDWLFKLGPIHYYLDLLNGKGFAFLLVTEPEFKLVLRNTVVKYYFSIYMQERKQLKDVLPKSCKEFALGLIVGLQSTSYMCAVAHVG